MKSPRLLVRGQGWLLWAGLYFLAGQTVIAESAIDFFTNVGDRLLQSRLNLSLTRIQVYPTNQYGPEVHRLLQVTANLYDSTTNRTDTQYPYLPSVFRPIFTNDNGNIFIAGYVEESRPLEILLAAPVRNLNNPDDRDALQPDDFVHGVPLIIGAKKGFPNFNEFSMQSVVQVMRRLELRRPSVGARPSETNEMYVVGISNVFAVEAWNSYRNPFPRDLELRVTHEVSITMTNENGLLRTSNMTIGQTMPVVIPANTWQGLVNPHFAPSSFRIPLLTNVIFLTNSVYRQLPPGGFVPVTAQFERGIGFPIPQWGLSISNRLRFILVDVATRRIVDYVNLDGLDANLEITRAIFSNFAALESSVMGNQWRTNRPNNATSIFTPTVGIINQIEVSLGNQQVSLSDWNAFGFQHVTLADKNKAIDAFRTFMGRTPIFYPGTATTNLIQQAPFTPTRKIYQNITWQANDPLVHYRLSDLTDLGRAHDAHLISPPNHPAPFLPNLSKINTRYQPWGGNPIVFADPNAFSLALKDPLVRRSDDWDFPESQPLNIAWLGRVHRGTPWQTIYLKSADVDLNVWKRWTGIADEHDARLTEPMNDWPLVSFFVSMLNTNNPIKLLSVNETEAAEWSRVLNGIQVLTNTLTDAELNTLAAPPQGFDSLVMQSNSPQAAIIADAIVSTRFSQPNQYFREIADILATPELSVASPWLNLGSSLQLAKGITDEAYEKIPQQILPLLRPDSVGSILWTNNQIRIQFTGFDGVAYRIESSRNLKQWKRLATFYPTNGVFSFVDSKHHGRRQRFYRSVLLPRSLKHSEKRLE